MDALTAAELEYLSWSGKRPVRCTWCFGRFMRNHTPHALKQEDGTIRWAHTNCAKAIAHQSNPRWPATTIRHDRDEPFDGMKRYGA